MSTQPHFALLAEWAAAAWHRPGVHARLAEDADDDLRGPDDLVPDAFMCDNDEARALIGDVLVLRRWDFTRGVYAYNLRTVLACGGLDLGVRNEHLLARDDAAAVRFAADFAAGRVRWMAIDSAAYATHDAYNVDPVALWLGLLAGTVFDNAHEAEAVAWDNCTAVVTVVLPDDLQADLIG